LIKPDHAEALSNRGNALVELKRPADALVSYERAIALNPGSAEAFNNRGNALLELKRPGDALASYDRALAIDPNNRSAFDNFANTALLCCDWKRKDGIAQRIDQRLEMWGYIDPFVMLCYSTDNKILISCARNYIRARIPIPCTPLYQRSPGHQRRIRIAYLSADFRVHAIARLIAELFEVHDRDRFEIIGVSYGKTDRSPMRSRLEKSFDQFHDVSGVSNAETARLLRQAEVDIAVDLNGYTRGARPEVLAFRPAPVQVNYLGYPGTMGAEFIDYIIADAIVLPFEQQAYYTEKIVHLPDCYQVNDRKREMAAAPPTRKDEGLPEVGFVFCCFNNNYKITREVFEIWLRLLKQVDGSVLWLLRDNETAQRNLRREAEAAGIASTRLVFAERVPLDRHLARHSLADLFLDTLPYNAHTTASDALWAGLPIVTCMGETFPGRVAASLLQAIGLPELVTSSALEYEQLAQRLASRPEELGPFRTKLHQNRLTFPLFDTDRFVRQLEAAYVRMWERSQAGLEPESFSVTAVRQH
jgi:predicted O-linked N-acetylglucosamine transferase (SPINDLY family)